jgi:hypothetical protein
LWIFLISVILFIGLAFRYSRARFSECLIVLWKNRKESVFMRAAAVAIVLIIGAVVILVFANTLNSWVLGGLIGGLAALLISIPISLFIFTFLARRHDQELQAIQQELEEMTFADMAENEYAGVYETDFYVLPEEDEFYNDPRSRRSSDLRALPAAGQSQASAAVKMGYYERAGNYPHGNRKPTQVLRQGRGKGTPTQNLSTDRRQPRGPRDEVNAMRARHQTAALRAARREAAQEFDDVEIMPTHYTASYRQVLPARSSQPLNEQPTRFKQARPTRVLPPQYQQQTARLPHTDALQMNQPRTDQLREGYPHPQTESLRHPQTGQMVRNPQLGEQFRNPEVIMGSLKNPLVRRAPYMYEDDPLRSRLTVDPLCDDPHDYCIMRMKNNRPGV